MNHHCVINFEQIMMMIIGTSLFAYVTAALASVVQSEDDKNAVYVPKLDLSQKK